MGNVFVTGGSRGIGAAIVRAFSARGDHVTFTYCRSESAAQILASQTGASAVRCDLSDPSSAKRAVASSGRIDILVNNAGVSHIGLITDMTDRQYRDLMAVNLDAVFYLCREVLPQMIFRKDGTIINIASMWATTGASCEVAYSASKAGVVGLTKALAKEVGPSGIRVNCICPGVIATDMNAHLSESDLRTLAEETPLCRIGTPEEVAQAALYFADARFVTGQVLGVDGGFAV